MKQHSRIQIAKCDLFHFWRMKYLEMLADRKKIVSSVGLFLVTQRLGSCYIPVAFEARMASNQLGHPCCVRAAAVCVGIFWPCLFGRFLSGPPTMVAASRKFNLELNGRYPLQVNSRPGSPKVMQFRDV